MAQGLLTTSTQIADQDGKVVPVDPTNGLSVDSPSIKELLDQSSDSIQNISNYLEILSQTGTKNAAASLPVAVANDQVVATSIPDVVVSGQIVRANTGGLASLPPTPGSFIDIQLNGHSTVTVQAISQPNNSYTLMVFVSLDGTNFVNFVSLGGTNFVNIAAPDMNMGNLTGGSILKGGYAAGNYISIVPCAGYKVVRLVCSYLSSSFANVTLSASSAMPMNYLSLLLSLQANTSVTMSQSTTPVDLVPRFIPNLSTKFLALYNFCFGLIINNPNDFTIYLLFFNANSVSPNTPIYFVLSIPPGFSTIPIGNFSIGNYTTGLCVAASSSPISYIKLPIGPDVTIFSSS